MCPQKKIHINRVAGIARVLEAEYPVVIKNDPSVCPICHRGIQPIYVKSILKTEIHTKKLETHDRLENIYI